jgi:hypothetical protein
MPERDLETTRRGGVRPHSRQHRRIILNAVQHFLEFRLAREPRLRNSGPGLGEKKMRTQSIAALVIVGLLAGALPAAAQQSEPPAAGNLRSRIKAKYLEKRDRFLHRTKDLYFAVGCKVLAGEAGILPLTSSDSYLSYIGDQTIIDTKDESLRQAAVQEGLDRASRPGECDYYRRHPEAAEAARRAAAEAAAKR